MGKALQQRVCAAGYQAVSAGRGRTRRIDNFAIALAPRSRPHRAKAARTVAHFDSEIDSCAGAIDYGFERRQSGGEGESMEHSECSVFAKLRLLRKTRLAIGPPRADIRPTVGFTARAAYALPLLAPPLAPSPSSSSSFWSISSSSCSRVCSANTGFGAYPSYARSVKDGPGAGRGQRGEKVSGACEQQGPRHPAAARRATHPSAP